MKYILAACLIAAVSCLAIILWHHDKGSLPISVDTTNKLFASTTSTPRAGNEIFSISGLPSDAYPEPKDVASVKAVLTDATGQKWYAVWEKAK